MQLPEGHRPPPPGLTAQQAWQVVKLFRLGSRVLLPLADENGAAFSYWLSTAAQETLHAVDRGLLTSVQQGRQRTFFAAEDLPKRLRARAPRAGKR